jgi:hypothetical protein
MNKNNIASTLRNFDALSMDCDDFEFDKMIGLDCKNNERRIDIKKTKIQYGFEQYIYEGTPYSLIRYFLKALSVKENDVIYDLGSGYGRIVFYGSLTKPSIFKGIEIVPERVTICNIIKQQLGLYNADFINGNVTELDYSDGNIFFLFNPFYPETLASVGDKLEKYSNNKKIRIATWGGPSNEFFSDQNWLKEIKFINQPKQLQFFESIKN